MIIAGRYKFMPQFYAFNHHIYQDMKYYDLQNMATYPKEIKGCVHYFLSNFYFPQNVSPSKTMKNVFDVI